MRIPKLYIVIPCYNEEACIVETVRQISVLMQEMTANGSICPDSRITLVDDGSRDRTWEKISELVDSNPIVEGIKLAHNAGHQNALWAGMMTVREHADAVVSIDADLQDDIHAIPKFVEAYQRGAEVVYGVRSRRDTDTVFKRRTAHAYYNVMRDMGVDLVYDHADYRLLGRAALDALSQYGEVNLFLRGMVPTLGFPQETVYYERGTRLAGESKYPLSKMISFALEGITSFSTRPIRLISYAGLLCALIGIAIAVWAVIQHFRGVTVAGWTSIMVSIWVVGGMQLIALGIIGEYAGKIYKETKKRPRYILEKYLQK